MSFFTSLRRIKALSTHCFTQLVRMKVFLFLGVFVALILAASFFELPWSQSAANTAEQKLILLKSSAMGAMNLFAILFAIAATSLLVPKDIEDRTLYTILAKPVTRLEYLLGKLWGVFLLIALLLLLMDGVLCVLLYEKGKALQLIEIARAKEIGLSEQALGERLEALALQGLTGNLQMGIVTLFLKSAVTACVALLISTLSSSTLFTILVTGVIYFIGHMVGDARDYWMHTQGKELPSFFKYITQLVSLIIPDLSLYNLFDASIEGRPIPMPLFVKILVLSFFYTAIYTLLSWFSFLKREF